MKEVIISTSCMGKTKLCKEFRDPSWRNSKSVDLDYKGVTTYSNKVRLANSMLAAALLDDGHDIITGFTGQFDYKQLLSDGVNITFAIPMGKLLDSLPDRSHNRKDSLAFTTLLERDRFKIAYRVWTDYCECLDTWRELVTEMRVAGLEAAADELSLLRPVLIYSSSCHAYVSDFVTEKDGHLTIDIDDDRWHPYRQSPIETSAFLALKALAEGSFYEI